MLWEKKKKRSKLNGETWSIYCGCRERMGRVTHMQVCGVGAPDKILIGKLGGGKKREADFSKNSPNCAKQESRE